MLLLRPYQQPFTYAVLFVNHRNDVCRRLPILATHVKPCYHIVRFMLPIRTYSIMDSMKPNPGE
jgi:hypothetical protein